MIVVAEKDKILEAIRKQRLIRDAAKQVGKEISSEREKGPSQIPAQKSERR